MTKLEELIINMQNEFKIFKDLNNELSNKKDMIIGCLNRISVSDNEEEVERLYNTLINYSIKDYKNYARECHKQWVVYENLLYKYHRGIKEEWR